MTILHSLPQQSMPQIVVIDTIAEDDELTLPYIESQLL